MTPESKGGVSSRARAVLCSPCTVVKFSNEASKAPVASTPAEQSYAHPVMHSDQSQIEASQAPIASISANQFINCNGQVQQ